MGLASLFERRIRLSPRLKEAQMNTSVRMRDLSDSTMFRWYGRAAGVILFVTWTIFVVSDLPRQDQYWGTYLQAAGLAIVFAGYLAGWWNELIGGVMTIVGTAVYFAICAWATQIIPRPETLMFAAPGVCYLLSHYFAKIENSGG